MIAIDINQAITQAVEKAHTAEMQAKERATVIAVASHGLDGLQWVHQQGPILGAQVIRLERHGRELWRCWWETGDLKMTLCEQWAPQEAT